MSVVTHKYIPVLQFKHRDFFLVKVPYHWRVKIQNQPVCSLQSDLDFKDKYHHTSHTYRFIPYTAGLTFYHTTEV